MLNADAMQGDDEWRKDMKQTFNELMLLVQDEHTVSAYELCTSGLVQALYSTLSVSGRILLVARDSCSFGKCCLF